MATQDTQRTNETVTVAQRMREVAHRMAAENPAPEKRAGVLESRGDGVFYSMLAREMLRCLRVARNAADKRDRSWWCGRAAGIADAWMIWDGTRQPSSLVPLSEHAANLAELFREPKTRASRRSVPLHSELVREMLALRDEQGEQKRLLGDGYSKLGLVFCQPNGKPLHAHNVVQRDLRRVLQRAGLLRLRFHDLRHTAATLLFAHAPEGRRRPARALERGGNPRCVLARGPGARGGGGAASGRCAARRCSTGRTSATEQVSGNVSKINACIAPRETDHAQSEGNLDAVDKNAS